MKKSTSITIVDYEPKYRNAFSSMNKAWIQKYFKMEPADHDALDSIMLSPMTRNT